MSELFHRAGVARELRRLGYNESTRTLERAAERGEGPAFIKEGGRFMYRLEDAVAWAASRMPPNDQDWRSRADISRLLNAAGFQFSTVTLACYASWGGGPPFRHFGRRVFYDLTTTLQWARERYQSKRSNNKAA